MGDGGYSPVLAELTRSYFLTSNPPLYARDDLASMSVKGHAVEVQRELVPSRAHPLPEHGPRSASLFCSDLLGEGLLPWESGQAHPQVPSWDKSPAYLRSKAWHWRLAEWGWGRCWGLLGSSALSGAPRSTPTRAPSPRLRGCSTVTSALELSRVQTEARAPRVKHTPDPKPPQESEPEPASASVLELDTC